MNRRDWLRTLAIGAAAVGGAPVLAALDDRHESATASAYLLFTARPDEDLKRLNRAAGILPSSSIVTSHPAAAYRQDLTVLAGGGVVDVVRDPSTDPALAEFAATLRRRPGEARYLLALEPRDRPTNNHIVIEQNGIVQEVIDPTHRFRRIDVDGPAGTTTFRLEDGCLSVTAASCRHRNCQHVGALRHGRIVCAPNRLVATLPSADGAIDMLAG